MLKGTDNLTVASEITTDICNVIFTHKTANYILTTLEIHFK